MSCHSISPWCFIFNCDVLSNLNSPGTLSSPLDKGSSERWSTIFRDDIWPMSLTCEDHLWGRPCMCVSSKTLGIIHPGPLWQGEWSEGSWVWVAARIGYQSKGLPSWTLSSNRLHSHRGLIICLKTLATNLSIPLTFKCLLCVRVWESDMNKTWPCLEEAHSQAGQTN